MTPRRYGFHGTLKPPFRLNGHQTLDDLERATSDLATSLAPASCDGLKLTQLGRFLALTLRGDIEPLRRVAAACVRELDGFRGPASEGELARQRKARLSARQEGLLMQWGYPYVMEEFRFHLTLAGGLSDDALVQWAETLRRNLPDLPAPFEMDQIALCGERDDGRFELIHRYTLAG